MAQLVAGASTQKISAQWKQVSLSQFFAASPVLPLGDGAYLSGKAVAQRTTDQRKHCEDKKWPECFATGGDYVDGRVASASAATPTEHSAALRMAKASRLLAGVA